MICFSNYVCGFGPRRIYLKRSLSAIYVESVRHSIERIDMDPTQVILKQKIVSEIMSICKGLNVLCLSRKDILASKRSYIHTTFLDKQHRFHICCYSFLVKSPPGLAKESRGPPHSLHYKNQIDHLCLCRCFV